MLQPGIQNFFHPAEFGSPQIAHVVEALVHGIELGIHERHQKPNQGGIKQHRDAGRQIKLLVRHHKCVLPRVILP
jgi:hypothetical protein